MQRTTIAIPAELLDQLRQMAAEQGVSVASLVRQAIEQKTKDRRPRPRSLGLGASGHTDTARRTGDEWAIPRPWR